MAHGEICLQRTGAARMSDVAKLAGVSVMTVSRALSGNSVVSNDLRQRVLSAAAALHYAPNEIARSLREQRSRQIGIIVPNLVEPFYAVSAHVAGEVAKRHAYSVVLATSDEDPRTEYDQACQMQRRHVAGLVVIPAAGRGTVARETASRSLLTRQQLLGLPMVLVDRPVGTEAFDCVLVDNLGGARQGIRHLLELGHRRIVFVELAQKVYTQQRRSQGYAAGMQEAGLTPSVARLSRLLDESVVTLRRLLNRRDPPTALFCANQMVARHMLHALKAMGHAPPKPLALISFDDFEMADLMQPGITVVRQPVEEMSRRATEMLFARLAADRQAPARQVVLPVELVVRGSCGAGERD